MKKAIFTAAICACIALTDVNAQDLKMPQPSSTQTVSQDFGLGNIKVVYSRPNVKGRKVFGELVPYGKVWRTGANAATVITFSEEVTINGETIPAGNYALFSIPAEKEWTVILNKNTQQWGAYTYKESDEFKRFKVQAQQLSSPVETFTIQFTNVFPTSAQLELVWGNTSIPLKLTTEVDSKVMAGIDEAMKGEKKPYFQAAQYYFANGKDLKKTLEWMNAAEAADPKAPWVRAMKARVQLKMGDKKGAAKTAEAGIKAAKDMNNEEYIGINTQLLADAKK
jgi:hypothetical protein